MSFLKIIKALYDQYDHKQNLILYLVSKHTFLGNVLNILSCVLLDDDLESLLSPTKLEGWGERDQCIRKK